MEWRKAGPVASRNAWEAGQNRGQTDNRIILLFLLKVSDSAVETGLSKVKWQ